MQKSIQRYYLRKQAQLKTEDFLHERKVVDPDLVLEYLNSKVDWLFLNQIDKFTDDVHKFEYDPEISDDEVGALFNEFRQNWDSEKFDSLLTACRDTVLNNIIRPFGLVGVLFEDKKGGNVTTIHNAKKGVYARKSDKYVRSGYGSPSEAMQTYKNGLPRIDGKIRDEYTGKLIELTKADIDHIKSISEFHKEGGFMVSDERKAKFASDKDNLAATERSLNRSKGDRNLKDWEQKNAPGGENDNKEKYGSDGRRTAAAQKRAEKTAKKYAPNMMEKGKFYTKQMVLTGVQEGVKMGLQQALGLLLQELVVAIFDEVQVVYRKGFWEKKPSEDFFQILKKRFNRVTRRVLNRWQNAVEAFRDGAISAFFSNMVTTIINMFATTGKRLVRIIREGFLSLLRAIRLVLFPPEGMTLYQAAHEASKLIAAGLTIAGGILLEELISQSVNTIPFLKPFADAISMVVIGTVTGLATTFLVYAIDSIDILGVNEETYTKNIIKKLDSEIYSAFEAGKKTIFITEASENIKC
jgi:hypothetical protein